MGWKNEYPVEKLRRSSFRVIEPLLNEEGHTPYDGLARVRTAGGAVVELAGNCTIVRADSGSCETVAVFDNARRHLPQILQLTETGDCWLGARPVADEGLAARELSERLRTVV